VHPFILERPRDLVTAIALAAAPGGPSAEYIAGGTDMLPLLKEEIRQTHGGSDGFLERQIRVASYPPAARIGKKLFSKVDTFKSLRLHGKDGDQFRVFRKVLETQVSSS